MANGGKRPGAGRPRGTTKKVKILRKATAELILSEVDEKALWKWCLKEDKEKGNTAGVRATLAYLTDRRDGKAAQAIMVEGKTPMRIIVGFNGNGDDPTA